MEKNIFGQPVLALDADCSNCGEFFLYRVVQTIDGDTYQAPDLCPDCQAIQNEMADAGYNF
jgi:hypothetical protein